MEKEDSLRAEKSVFDSLSLFSLSISLALSVSVSLSLSLFESLFDFLLDSLFDSPSLSLSLSLNLSLNLFLNHSLTLSWILSLTLSLSLSLFESLFEHNSGGVRILIQAESEKASLGLLEFLERDVAMVVEPRPELFGGVTEERVGRQWMPARSHQHSLTRIRKRVSSSPV